MRVTSTLGTRLRAARQLAKMTLADLARHFGHTIAAVQQWERDKTLPSPDKVVKFAELTGVDLLWIMTGEKKASESSTQQEEAPAGARPRLVPKIDLLGISVRDLQTGVTSKVTTIAQFPCSTRAFAIEITDNSNAPRFEPGDQVIVDPEVAPVPGDMVLASVGAQQLQFRKFRLQGNVRGATTVLEPLNIDWPTTFASGKSVRLIGVMSEHTKPRR